MIDSQRGLMFKPPKRHEFIVAGGLELKRRLFLVFALNLGDLGTICLIKHGLVMNLIIHGRNSVAPGFRCAHILPQTSDVRPHKLEQTSRKIALFLKHYWTLTFQKFNSSTILFDPVCCRSCGPWGLQSEWASARHAWSHNVIWPLWTRLALTLSIPRSGFINVWSVVQRVGGTVGIMSGHVNHVGGIGQSTPNLVIIPPPLSLLPFTCQRHGEAT